MLVRMSRWVLLSGLAIAVLLISIGCGGGASEEGVVKIGFNDGITGAIGSVGTPAFEGAQLAIDKINGAGGINVNGKKYKLQLVSYDNRGDPKEAVAITEKLITKDQVKFIFGLTSSPSAMPSQEITNKNKVLAFSASTQIETILGKPETAYLFKTLGGEGPPYGKAVGYVPWAVKKLGIKNIALMSPLDVVGDTFDKLYAATFEENGVKVVARERFERAGADFYPQLTKIKAANPEALAVSYTDEDALKVFRQALELGVTKKLVGISSTTVAVAKEFQGKFTDYTFVISTRNFDTDDATIKQYLADYKQKFGKDAGSSVYFSLYYYDPIMVLSKSMEKAGTVDNADKIAEALRGMEYKGVMSYWVDPKINYFAHGFDVGYVGSDGKVNYDRVEVR